jgi:hypothetical protein
MLTARRVQANESAFSRSNERAMIRQLLGDVAFVLVVMLLRRLPAR